MDKAFSEPSSADGPSRPSSWGLTQTLVAPSCGAALFIPVSHLGASPARALQSNLPPRPLPRRAPQETHTSCPWPHLAPQQGDRTVGEGRGGGGNARRRGALSRAVGATECLHVVGPDPLAFFGLTQQIPKEDLNDTCRKSFENRIIFFFSFVGKASPAKFFDFSGDGRRKWRRYKQTLFLSPCSVKSILLAIYSSFLILFGLFWRLKNCCVINDFSCFFFVFFNDSPCI